MAFSLWKLPLIDLYALMRPFIFMVNPDRAYELTILMLKLGLGPREAVNAQEDPVLKTSVFGLTFDNPVGLAAGFDKQAEVIDACFNMGFGFIEIGGVTPRPQVGNPLPRMWRIPEEKAVINYIGLPSVGIDVFAKRLGKWFAKSSRIRRPLGVNLSKNRETEDEIADFVLCLNKVAPYADFVVLNVSCPNVQGVCGLQNRERLEKLMQSAVAARDAVRKDLPILVKIAPSLSDEQMQDVAQAVTATNIQGLVVGNTHAEPNKFLKHKMDVPGGLSGEPLFDVSTQALRRMYQLTEGKVPLIGTGGIASGEQAYAKIRAGASLIQLYTALIYHGPLLATKINTELAACLKRDGFKSVNEAIGADNR